MRVAVLGNGQLGRMLRQAGDRIGVKVDMLDIEADRYPAADTLLTVEREHWPLNPFTEALQKHPHYLNATALYELANRIRQKSLLDRLGVATSPWCAPDATTTPAALHAQLGSDIFLKRAQGGYDGRGQQRLKAATPEALPEWATQAIAEQAIPFDREVSIVGARNRAGDRRFYGLTENRHENGILTMSIYQAGRFDHLQQKAEQMLGTVMDALDYVGVMAMELFVVGDQLLVNEIAPRVHNSGHWTQNGASIDQFELHLRAVCDLPLAQPLHFGTSVMVNLLGMEFNPAWLALNAAHCHWYGKQCQPGRKMGHLNFHHVDTKVIADNIDQLALPPLYQSSVQWLNSLLRVAV